MDKMTQFDAARIRLLRLHGMNEIAEYVESLLSIISQKDEIIDNAVNALKRIGNEYMEYIENNIEVDTAATRMDTIAENALSVIGALTTIQGEETK